jgi:hypothetical protein
MIIDDATIDELTTIYHTLAYLNPHDKESFKAAKMQSCGITAERPGEVWRGLDSGRVVMAAASHWTYDDRNIVEAFYLT